MSPQPERLETESSSAISRRGLLGAAAAGATALAVPREAAAAGVRTQHRRLRELRRVDVAVVGAGLAGLTAAEQIQAEGRSVLVFEARNRVGGRTLNVDGGPGRLADGGGTWIGPTQDRIAAKAKKYGVGDFLSYTQGKTIYVRDGRRQEFEGLPVPAQALPEVAKAITQLDQMASEVPRDGPWKAPHAQEWDGQTLETWKQGAVVSPDARFLIDLGCRAVFVCEPKEISLLHVLFMISAAGNESTPGSFLRLISTSGGAQERHFAKGAQAISQAMARALGRRVFLNAPVRRIAQHAKTVDVVCDRLSARAKRVIVAVPPALQARLDFAPALPAVRAQLLQRWPQGTEIKYTVFYDKPFWRQDGYVGSVYSDQGPIVFTADGSPADGSYGVMLAWIKAHDARYWSQQPQGERDQAVLRSLSSYYGEQALQPAKLLSRDWSAEEWTRGCFGAFGSPGMLTEYGEHIREPVGRVHWAGTETSTLWYGYMDGAVRSGERAAAEVLERL